MNEPRTYTAKDIERYQRGEMTPAEMHLLEEASLDDPFLADALEGYQHTATTSADLIALKKRLQQRIDGRRKTGAAVFMNSWMKVAAVLVVLIGGGWLVLQTFSGRSSLQMERLSKSGAVEKNTAAQSSDSVSSVSTLATPLADTNKQEKETNNVASRNEGSKAYSTQQRTAATSALTRLKKNPLGVDKNGYTASANTMAKSEARTTSKDTGQFLPQEQSTAAVPAPSLDTVRHIDVTMKPTNDALAEVIITKSSKARRLAGRNSGVTIDTLEPAQGWSSFENYVADNLEIPRELKEKMPFNNEVELSFDVDGEGNPVNIAVTKPLCDKCDQEAIRLLKEGPKWKGKKKSGKVKIQFPLSP